MMWIMKRSILSVFVVSYFGTPMDFEIIELNQTSHQQYLPFDDEKNDLTIPHAARVIFMQYAWNHRHEDTHTFNQFRSHISDFYKSSMDIEVDPKQVEPHKRKLSYFLYEQSEKLPSLERCHYQILMSKYNKMLPLKESIKDWIEEYIDGENKYDEIRSFLDLAKHHKINLNQERLKSAIESAKKAYWQVKKTKATSVMRELFWLGSSLFSIIVGAQQERNINILTIKDGYLIREMRDRSNYEPNKYQHLPLSHVMKLEMLENDRISPSHYISYNKTSAMSISSLQQELNISTYVSEYVRAYTFLLNQPKIAIITLGSVGLGLQALSWLNYFFKEFCCEECCYSNHYNPHLNQKLANLILDNQKQVLKSNRFQALEQKIARFIKRTTDIALPSSSDVLEMIKTILEDKESLKELQGKSRTLDLFCNLAALYRYTPVVFFNGGFTKVNEHIKSAGWKEPSYSFFNRAYVALHHDWITQILYRGIYFSGFVAASIGLQQTKTKQVEISWGDPQPVPKNTIFYPAGRCPSVITEDFVRNYNNTMALYYNNIFFADNRQVWQNKYACDSFMEIDSSSNITLRFAERYTQKDTTLSSIVFGLSVMNVAALSISLVLYYVILSCN